MKKSFYLMAAFLVTMVGCNKEPQAGPGQGLNSEDKVYMEFSIQTLTTRSGTDQTGDTNSNANPDYEVGKDSENAISKVDVVLRNGSTYVSATVANPVIDNTTDTKNGVQKWIATFNSDQLATNTDYQVYIYANCSAKQDVDAVSNASIDEMTEENNFWMTNAYAPNVVNFASYSTDKNNPTLLGEHYVERAMARFDYMPKGPYTLGDGVQVTLTDAALINQSKAFYMLRRVSDDGMPTGANFAIGGVETPMNYVVDTDYAEKNNNYQETDANNFDAHLSAPATWTWKSIVKTDEWVADNWNGVGDGNTNNDDDHTLNEYYVWQYCKENTIPGTNAQVNGLSTGIVFKGELSGSAVPQNGTEPIYVFENVLYGTWAQVVEAAKTTTSEALKFAVSVCNNTDNTAKGADILKTAGFTGYTPVGGKYHVYYYYWNRHNDNGENQNMGKMEFAVVRNNVYKLCVDSIERFGHPTPGGNDPDPDPVDPTDPDEQKDYYFSVTVKVLPWVVRVNHIEF